MYIPRVGIVKGPDKRVGLLQFYPPFFLRLRHPLPIPKLTLILGVPRLLAVLLVAILLPIAPADEVVPAAAVAYHNAHHVLVISSLMFFHRGIHHHAGRGEPRNVKSQLHIHGKHYASRFGTEFEPQTEIGNTLHQEIPRPLVFFNRT